MKKLFLTCFCCASAVLGARAQDEHIVIWDNASAPTSSGLFGPTVIEKEVFVANNNVAELFVYKAEEPSGRAVVVCPGGGYHNLAIGYEGHDMARWLADHGYPPTQGQPVDLFPRTKHVETVVLLSKGEIDSKKVRVEFSLEDMDMSGFQKGATYEQIKAYVLEHTGLKVSSLYISQIKRKCGLDVGQNYNLSKKEDAKVPQCPPEKEAAIMEALKYFQII